MTFKKEYKPTENPEDRYRLEMLTPEKIRLKQYSEAHLYKAAKAKFIQARDRAKAAAEEKVFRVAGEQMNRYQIMDYLVLMMETHGISLPDLLKGRDGDILPLAREVRKWKDLHPNFAIELDEASKWRGEILGSEALNAVMNAKSEKVITHEDGTQETIEIPPDKNALFHAKLKAENLTLYAGFNNDKYRIKTIHQNEDITDKLSEDELKEKFRMLVKDNPQILEMFTQTHPELKNIIEAQVLENSEPKNEQEK
jgi:hypothetical protein